MEEEHPHHNEIGDDVQPAPSVELSGECGFPDPRTASLGDIQAALRGIIEKEGPLTKRFLIRLSIKGCPTLHRAAKNVKSLLNRALYGMQKSGEIVVDDELGDRSDEPLVLRLVGSPRVRERPAGRRQLMEIPPSELLLMLDRLSGSALGTVQSEENLMRALLEHYGFPRLTETRKSYLARILEGYRRRLLVWESDTVARRQ